MLRLTRTRRLIIAIAIIGLFAIPVFGFGQGAQGASASSSERVWEGNFNGWHYTEYIDTDGYVNASVLLDSNTVSGVRSYATSNQALAQQLWQTGQKECK